VSRPLPAIDAHAHLEATIASAELDKLPAAILAVTRTPQEWQVAAQRLDKRTAWGLGFHPGRQDALDSFEEAALPDQMNAAAFVGEVGLDARSKVPFDQQRNVFRAILGCARAAPTMLSVHSVGASAQVIEEILVAPSPGIVLHWWRGTPEETSRAIDAGCWFSVNGAEIRRPKILAQLPRNRVLTETDFPFSRRSDSAADRPGAVTTTEHGLAKKWELTQIEVRRQIWENFAELAEVTGVEDRLPRAIQATLLSL
jgi:TatD DNase family protein